MITARLIKRPDMTGIMKQVNFGTAKGLTDTAKQGQAAVVGAIKGTFTTRGNWFNQNMKHGIKITPELLAAVNKRSDAIDAAKLRHAGRRVRNRARYRLRRRHCGAS